MRNVVKRGTLVEVHNAEIVSKKIKHTEEKTEEGSTKSVVGRVDYVCVNSPTILLDIPGVGTGIVHKDRVTLEGDTIILKVEDIAVFADYTE